MSATQVETRPHLRPIPVAQARHPVADAEAGAGTLPTLRPLAVGVSAGVAMLLPLIALSVAGVSAFTPALLLGPLLPFALLTGWSALTLSRGQEPSLRLARMTAAAAALTALALAGAFGSLMGHLGIGVVGVRGVSLTQAPLLASLMLGLPLAAVLAARGRELGARRTQILAAWRLGGASIALSAAIWWSLATWRSSFAGLDIWQRVWFGGRGLTELPQTSGLGTGALVVLALLGGLLVVAGRLGRDRAARLDGIALGLDLD